MCCGGVAEVRIRKFSARIEENKRLYVVGKCWLSIVSSGGFVVVSYMCSVSEAHHIAIYPSIRVKFTMTV